MKDLESLPEPPARPVEFNPDPPKKRQLQVILTGRWTQWLIAGFTALGILSGAYYLFLAPVAEPAVKPAVTSIAPSAPAALLADRYLFGVAERSTTELGRPVSPTMVLEEWCKLPEIGDASHATIQEGWESDSTFPTDEATPTELHDELDSRC